MRSEPKEEVVDRARTNIAPMHNVSCASVSGTKAMMPPTHESITAHRPSGGGGGGGDAGIAQREREGKGGGGIYLLLPYEVCVERIALPNKLCL